MWEKYFYNHYNDDSSISFEDFFLVKVAIFTEEQKKNLDSDIKNEIPIRKLQPKLLNEKVRGDDSVRRSPPFKISEIE